MLHTGQPIHNLELKYCVYYNCNDITKIDLINKFHSGWEYTGVIYSGNIYSINTIVFYIITRGCEGSILELENGFNVLTSKINKFFLKFKWLFNLKIGILRPINK